MMIKVAGSNITCALGLTTSEVYKAVHAGTSGLSRHSATGLGVIDDYVASVVDQSSIPVVDISCTKCELMAIHSVRDALEHTDVDPVSERTVFVISSTKGNIDLLDKKVAGVPDARVYLTEMARFISRGFGNPNEPIVVSNACISGLSAIILAKRLLENGIYDHAIVCGVDVVSKFTVSGFQSFKALSHEECRPFDSERCGLNLGEGAATIVLSAVERTSEHGWYVSAGVVHNDANHISGPSRVGEGSFRCLMDVTKGIDVSRIAVINAHGTATPYNDEMEAIAIDRAGLSGIPVNAFKGYLGHTLGTAGILESILSMKSVGDGILLPTRGHTSTGNPVTGTLPISRPLDVVKDLRPVHGDMFVKLLSGFGGCNAAVRYTKGGVG